MQSIEAIEGFASALATARRVAIIGGYGCGNAGDEAILSVLLAEPVLAARDVTVISRDPTATTGLHGVRSVAARPADALRALAACDAVVIGGGGIFSGYMGRRSMLLPIVAAVANATGRKVLHRAIGVYSSTPRPVARMLVGSMERAAFVSVRDQASADALRGFGLRRKPIIEPDPALRLTAEPYDCELPPRPVGLALRRVREPAAQKRLRSVYVATIASIADNGYSPVLLPFSQHPTEHVEQDASYLRQLRQEAGMPAALLLGDLPPRQLLAVIRSLDALIAMRFHAIVFGHIAATPTIAIPYDDKCSAFADKHSIAAIPLADVSAKGMSKALSGLLPQGVAA